jgi:hypothetical protein
VLADVIRHAVIPSAKPIGGALLAAKSLDRGLGRALRFVFKCLSMAPRIRRASYFFNRFRAVIASDLKSISNIA